MPFCFDAEVSRRLVIFSTYNVTATGTAGTAPAADVSLDAIHGNTIFLSSYRLSLCRSVDHAFCAAACCPMVQHFFMDRACMSFSSSFSAALTCMSQLLEPQVLERIRHEHGYAYQLMPV